MNDEADATKMGNLTSTDTESKTEAGNWRMEKALDELLQLQVHSKKILESFNSHFFRQDELITKLAQEVEENIRHKKDVESQRKNVKEFECSRSVCRFSKECEKLQKQIIIITAQLESAHNVKATDEDVITTLRRNGEQLETENSRLKQNYLCLKSENDKLLKKIKILELRCSELEEQIRTALRRPISVSLFSSVQQKLVQSVSKELEQMIQCHMQTVGIDINLRTVGHPSERIATQPLIIMCINASRLGTDVHQALMSVHCDNSVALIVLHHKEIHALPSQTSDKLLTGEKYRDLGIIVDVAYTTTKGMYPCNMNENALAKISSFLAQFKP